ncbi:hypothetical protein ACIQAS_10580 [Bacillus safensis]|uniref:hypothetical protein n=1 Tax=Bacillus safensis TaxID=561879 RepID=UPI0038226DAA
MCCDFRSSWLDCLAAAEEKHQQESKTNTEQLSKLKSDQTDNEACKRRSKKKLSTITKKLKKEKKAYPKELKQRKALESKIDQLPKEMTAAKATAQANKQTAQATQKTTVKKAPNVTHNPPSQWVQDQYDWCETRGYERIERMKKHDTNSAIVT